MCSNLSHYQLKTDCYLHMIVYVHLMVTTRKKLITNTQKKIRKKFKHNTKEYHQNTMKERKRKRNKHRRNKNSQKTINEKAISTYLSIITLNVNGLNSPIKRHGVAEWIKKQHPFICCLQETHFRSKKTHRMKLKRWIKIFHESGDEKKAGVAIIRADKIDFKAKTVISDKEGHYIMNKGSIQ